MDINLPTQPAVHYNIGQAFAVQRIGPMFDFFPCDNCLHSLKNVIFVIFIEFSL